MRGRSAAVGALLLLSSAGCGLVLDPSFPPDVPACPPDTVRCPGGCFNLRNDVRHCGGCNSACAMLPNALTLCGGGMCAFGGCTAGFGNCDGDPRTGCETALATDLRHCGACNHPCPMGATCERGTCVCPPGRALCGGICTDLQSDPRNCGACARACGPAERCVEGTCTAGCTLGDDTEILRRCSTSLACLLGLRCVLNRGVCVPDECLTDFACRNGTLCRQETLPLVCGTTTETVTVRRCR